LRSNEPMKSMRELQLMLSVFQVGILEQDAFEVVCLIRVWNNMLAPINKIPPEVLSLIPDFWNMRNRDQDIITLTHVCRAWREVSVSQTSLWTNFDCLDREKIRVCFERSKPCPINLSLDLNGAWNPFFQIIPHATGRLEPLSIEGPSDNLEVVASHLSHPAPSSSIFRYVQALDTCQIITPHYHPHSSMEIYLRYARYLCIPFTPSCLGGT